MGKYVALRLKFKRLKTNEYSAIESKGSVSTIERRVVASPTDCGGDRGAAALCSASSRGAKRGIAVAAGQVVWFWDHDPFGNGDPTGSFTYNLRFPGQYHRSRDEARSQLFPRLRSEAFRRYVESDPIGWRERTTTYAYAGGNPIREHRPVRS